LPERSFKDYFSLWGPRAVFSTKGSENRRQIVLFLGVAAGAASKVLYDAFVSTPINTDWKPLVLALIASIVVFPQLYYYGGLDKRKLSFAHWTFAFQNGFFWSVALSRIAPN
jgi:hypothetical protein